MTSVLDPFRRWAALPELAVLHVETTGFRGQVVELGLVDRQGETLFLARVRPTCPVEAGAQEFHGIGDAALERLPTLDQHWPALAALLRTHQVVGYNLPFITDRLDESLNAVMPRGWAYPDDDEPGFSADYQPLYALRQNGGCVMETYTPVYDNRQSFGGGLRPAKLSVACEREGVETGDLPPITTSIGSALRTLRLIGAVATRAEGSS